MECLIRIHHQSYYPISLCVYHRNCQFLWMKIEKGDLINQLSLSFILFIINSFDLVVQPSPHRAPYSRVIDWSWFRSNSSFIQSFILSNTIERHCLNASFPITTVIREGRLERLNDGVLFPTSLWITIDSTELDICSIWADLNIQNTDGWRDNKWSEGYTWLLTVM